MSAIPSLLRVMSLRDAEAIVLEAGKVPTLRRRGQVEAMAMPALDAALLEEFATPLLAERGVTSGSVVFRDDGGASYQIVVERVAAGLRLVARPASTPTPAPAPAPAPAPLQLTPSRRNQPATPVASTSDESRATTLARLAAALRPALAEARERGASDLFVSTGEAPRLRIDGELESAHAEVDPDVIDACVVALDPSVTGSCDHSLDVDGSRVRISAFSHLGGHAVVARLIRDRVPTLAELQLPPELTAIADQRDGLVLVCGPTGAGKSSTLAALLELLMQRRATHVITIEDPIEFRFAARRGLVHQRELGEHVPSFAAGVRAALRESPDVILLGELRDRETIAAALTAAETGHLVLASMHAASCAGAIDRVIDVFPEGQQREIRAQLAGALRSVTTQYLLPRRTGGRSVAIEHVPVTPAVANIIRKGDLQLLASTIQSGRDAGMIPLERSLAKLLDTGAVSSAAVKKIAADHDLLAALAPKLQRSV